MTVETQFNNLGANASKLGSATLGAVKDTFSASTWKKGAGEIAKDTSVLGIIFKPFVWAGQLGLKLVAVPIDLALRASNFVLGKSAALVKSNPRTAVIGGTIAAVAGGMHMVAKHKAKNLEAQADVIQQMQAMQATAPQASSYMNSASYADVQAKMDADRANGATPASQTAAFAAREATSREASATPAV